MSKFYDYRQFDILSNIATPVDACAQFTYKGFQISFSTVNRSVGACHNHVCIFYGQYFQTVFKDGFHTVEEAIKFIDEYRK